MTVTFYKEQLGTALDDDLMPEFDIYNEEFMAGLLAYVSAWSYSDRRTFIDKLKQKLIFQGGDFMEVSVVNDAMFVVAHAYIVRTADESKIICVFRGTEVDNVVNWLTDAGTKKMERFNGIQLHSGFYRNWKEVWDGPRGVEAHLLNPFKLEAAFADYENANAIPPDGLNQQDNLADVYMTGHSLGGAMAVVAALCMHQEQENLLWRKLRFVYTYGQPMVVASKSRAAAQDRVGARLKRYIYFNDIIPHLPPLLTGAYDHVGDEYKYMPSDTLLPWPHRGEWRKRGDHVIDKVIRSRTTQLFTFVGALPFALGDFVFYNVQLISKLKSPWSLNDHIPYFYVDSFEENHPVQENACVIS